jgi:hypothetical protein
LNNTNNPFNLESATEQADQPETPSPRSESKKPFIEPIVSTPIDVLEATSFFLQQSSTDTSDL